LLNKTIVFDVAVFYLLKPTHGRDEWLISCENDGGNETKLPGSTGYNGNNTQQQEQMETPDNQQMFPSCHFLFFFRYPTNK
jgi:hypothetical protein